MYKLTVFTPSKHIFDTYYYGYGTVVSQTPREDGWIETVVDYGDDSYRAEYQSGRFASGLYWATVEQV